MYGPMYRFLEIIWNNGSYLAKNCFFLLIFGLKSCTFSTYQRLFEET